MLHAPPRIYRLAAWLLLAAGFVAGAADTGDAPKPGLLLSSSWNIGLAKGDTKTKDVFDVIGICGRKTVNLEPASIPLEAGIAYLMPLSEALKLLGKTVASKKSVTCPGFPPGCLRYYSFDGNFPERCNKLHLVTDLNDRVVGMEYVDESPADVRMVGHTTGYNLYNFIETKAKASANWKIIHRPTVRGNLLVVRSELVDNRGQAKEYVRLLLAMPVVDIISLTSNENAMQAYNQRVQDARKEETDAKAAASAPASAASHSPAARSWIVGTEWLWWHNAKLKTRVVLEFQGDGVALIKKNEAVPVQYRWTDNGEGSFALNGTEKYTLRPDEERKSIAVVQLTVRPGEKWRIQRLR